MTTFAAHRQPSVNATRLATIVALLVAVLAATIALSSRHTNADTGAARSVTTSSVTSPSGNLTRSQAVAHAQRIDAAGSRVSSLRPVRPTVVTPTGANPNWSKLAIMDAHGTS